MPRPLPDDQVLAKIGEPPLDPAWLASIEREVQAGLPREQARRLVALNSMAYYRLRGAEKIPVRAGENDRDYQERPKRTIPFTRRVVRVLASKLYAPGPTREVVGDPGATEWLTAAYGDCHINSRWQQADRMSHLNGMCAFQVAASGDPKRPLKIQFWAGWHEIIPFEAPGRANEVAACVTIDAVDNQTTYTLWTRDQYLTYRTDKLADGQTAGGRVAKFVAEESGVNPYKCLPFAFVWYEPPDGGIDCVEGLGRFLSDLNGTIDIEISDMAQAMQKYHLPIPVAYDCDVETALLTKPGGFMHVVASVDGETANPSKPRLEYLQAQLDIEGGWSNIRGIIDSELEALNIPLTAYRMDSRTLPSGEALLQEQAPLIEYANERREPFRSYEAHLAKVCLMVGGTYYKRPDLLAAAKDVNLTLTWPPPSLSLPSVDRDQQDKTSLDLGLESRVMIVQRRYGMTRDQAVAHLKQAIDDEAELAKFGLQPVPGAVVDTPPDPAADPVTDANGGADGDPADDDLLSETD